MKKDLQKRLIRVAKVLEKLGDSDSDIAKFIFLLMRDLEIRPVNIKNIIIDIKRRKDDPKFIDMNTTLGEYAKNFARKLSK